MGFARRWVYISSDTLEPILETKQLLEKADALAAYSIMPRLKNGFCHDAWNNFPQNSTQSTILLLMELLMALEADAWIGTRISTWGRIIDLLRCEWTDKCKNPYIEVGSLQQTAHGDQHMYHEFVIPKHAKESIWQATKNLGSSRLIVY